MLVKKKMLVEKNVGRKEMLVEKQMLVNVAKKMLPQNCSGKNIIWSVKTIYFLKTLWVLLDYCDQYKKSSFVNISCFQFFRVCTGGEGVTKYRLIIRLT